MTLRGTSRWFRRWMWLVGPLVTAIVFGSPVLLLHWVTDEAVSCFASIPERADVALPPCDRNVGWLARLEGLPFVGRPAMRAREEIVARMVTWRYVDAAVGLPDREVLDQSFDPLKPAAYTIWEGSMRLRMDEVGPPMLVPDPGELAFGVGDRRTLDDRAFSWTQHYTATRAMEAALYEARIDRAVRLAEHYQGRPNSDLRIRVGALLCAGGQPALGIEQVTSVEADRAGHRTANFARNFGDARVVIEACAHLAGAAAPPVPLHGEAGAWDHRERLMTMRLRMLRQKNPACRMEDALACTDTSVLANLDHAREILRSERLRRHRLPLFAALADSVQSLKRAEALGSPRSGEPPLSAAAPLFAEDWLVHESDAPFVTAERFEASARHVAELAMNEPGVPPLSRAMYARAAVGYAQRDDLGAADRCIVAMDLGAAMLAVMRSQAALIAGHRDLARERAADDAPRHPALLLLRAELALPDGERARSLAKEALAQSKLPRLTERIRWLLVSLGVPTRGNTVAETHDPPPRYRYTGWPNPNTSPDVRARNVDDALFVWFDWLRDDNRRLARYRAFAHRGDAPEGLTPLLFAGSQLADGDFSSVQTETWLDALMAFDARRFSVRQVAFGRWRAALWRGDEVAAKLWRKRHLDLAGTSQDPKRADLLRSVRL